jgi:hypothetical protein
MRNLVFLLGLAAAIAAPSISFANLPLEMPPILAGSQVKCATDANCTGSGRGNYCCSGTCTNNHPCVNTCSQDTNCTGSSYGNYCCSNKCGNNHPCINTCSKDTDCTGSSYGNYCCSGTCGAVSCLTGGLNDTGITAKVGTSGQEDADFGRDANATTNSDSNGYKGFSFTKLDSSCNALTDQTQTSFSFVKDNVTGLIWEIKADPTELPWYDSTSATNGGDAGGYNSGANTEWYISNANWCDKTDWRLPTIKELVGLINSSTKAVAVDQNYFPNINLTIDPITKKTNAYYWSSTPSAATPVSAWAVDFNSGLTSKDYYKTSFNSVMLVRPAN